MIRMLSVDEAADVARRATANEVVPSRHVIPLVVSHEVLRSVLSDLSDAAEHYAEHPDHQGFAAALMVALDAVRHLRGGAA